MASTVNIGAGTPPIRILELIGLLQWRIFVNPERKRDEEWSGGLISDAEMGRRIISEYEQRNQG